MKVIMCPPRLLPQWLCCNSCTALGETVHPVLKCMSCHKPIVVITGRVLCFSRLHVYYAHLASVISEHSVCCGSLMTTYYIYVYIKYNIQN